MELRSRESEFPSCSPTPAGNDWGGRPPFLQDELLHKALSPKAGCDQQTPPFPRHQLATTHLQGSRAPSGPLLPGSQRLHCHLQEGSPLSSPAVSDSSPTTWHSSTSDSRVRGFLSDLSGEGSVENNLISDRKCSSECKTNTKGTLRNEDYCDTLF